MAKKTKTPTKHAEEHITPPFKLGHSEKQVLLRGEGLPAAGRVTSCWAKDGALMVNGEHVPGILRDAINKKAYYKCSVEIYDDPPEEIKEVLKKHNSSGKVLRAIALLGEDLPRVKALKDLPELYKETGAFKEPIEAFKAGVKNDDGKAYTKQDIDDICRNFSILKAEGVDPSKFSEDDRAYAILFYEPTTTKEGDTMDAAAIRKMLEEKGISPEVLKMLDDNALLAFVDACKSNTSDNDDKNDDGDKSKTGDGDGDEPKKTDNTDTKPMTYAEAQAMIKKGISDGMKVAMTAFNEAAKKNKATLADASDEAVKAIKKTGNQSRLSAFSEIVTKATDAGLPPALSEGGKLDFIAQTLLESEAVKKFGEKEISAYDLFTNMIKDIPAIMPKKGEKGAVIGGNKTDFDEHKKVETQKVRDTYQKFSETFDNAGVSEEDLVKAFHTELKTDRTLTAAKHLQLDLD